MSVSNSSSTNDSLPPQLPSSNLSLYSSPCLNLLYTYATFSLTSIVLLLPLSVFVLYLGVQRWRQQRSSAAMMSHSDFFTYNIVIIELIGVSGSIMSVYSTYANVPEIEKLAFNIAAFLWSGQTFFPILTCVEHYVAVVHPLIYLRLRQGSGVRVRDITTFCVWFLGLAGPSFMALLKQFPENSFMVIGLQTLLLLSITFCSLSVLYVLTRPRPGEAGGNRFTVHQSKKRAFYTITVIMGVLSMRFGGSLLCNAIVISPTVSTGVVCVMVTAKSWFALPSSLVLPLLFLHRVGKLPGCRHNTGSG